MSSDEKETVEAAEPREPLIVEVPTVLSRIQAQLRRQAGSGEFEGPPNPNSGELEPSSR